MSCLTTSPPWFHSHRIHNLHRFIQGPSVKAGGLCSFGAFFLNTPDSVRTVEALVSSTAAKESRELLVRWIFWIKLSSRWKRKSIPSLVDSVHSHSVECTSGHLFSRHPVHRHLQFHYSLIDEAGCRKRFAGSSTGEACAENSRQQSKCHQLVKSAAARAEILPLSGPGSNGQAPPAQIGFSCSGPVDRPQFALVLRAVGWTIFSSSALGSNLSGFPAKMTPPAIAAENRQLQPASE